MDGTIHRLVQDRAFGFLQEEGSTATYFFHKSNLLTGPFAALTEGAKVEFRLDVDERSGREQAFDVSVIEPNED